MDEATQTGPALAPAPPANAISTTQAAAMLAERRAQASGGNDVSEAARKLGQRAAEARRERQAQPAQTQGPSQGEGGNVEDDPANAETLNETAATEPPIETNTTTEGEPEQAQTIDLGEGVTVTLDEVRDSFMLKADHTRKTQALAEKEKAVEAVRTQKLAQLEKVVGMLEQAIGRPKTLSQLIQEHGRDDALEHYAKQEEDQKRLAAAHALKDRQRGEYIASREAERDAYLSETYNKEWSDPTKREAAYTELTGYALQLGANPDTLRKYPEVFAEPWAIKVLDKARQYDALQASKGKITKTIADVPKVTRPGAKITAQAGAHNAAQAAQARAKSSGKLADAVAFLQARRKAGVS